MVPWRFVGPWRTTVSGLISLIPKQEDQWVTSKWKTHRSFQLEWNKKIKIKIHFQTTLKMEHFLWAKLKTCIIQMKHLSFSSAWVKQTKNGYPFQNYSENVTFSLGQVDILPPVSLEQQFILTENVLFFFSPPSSSKEPTPTPHCLKQTSATANWASRLRTLAAAKWSDTLFGAHTPLSAASSQMLQLTMPSSQSWSNHRTLVIMNGCFNGRRQSCILLSVLVMMNGWLKERKQSCILLIFFLFLDHMNGCQSGATDTNCKLLWEILFRITCQHAGTGITFLCVWKERPELLGVYILN